MTSNNNDPRFVKYYEEASATEDSTQRARRLMNTLLRARQDNGLSIHSLSVADIGCNAGTHSRCWLENSHRVNGIDISEKLINIAMERNRQFGVLANFEVGSATSLPWPDQQFDVVLLPELLEHVDDWRSCISEAIRVLKPGGSLFLSTTNRLCPIQQEFDLPLYSWYPQRLKSYCTKLAITSKPYLVNFTTFPAIHWFSPYQLRAHLRNLGVSAVDRFDLIDINHRTLLAKALITAIRSAPPLRFMAHVLTPYTFLVGHKT